MKNKHTIEQVTSTDLTKKRIGGKSLIILSLRLFVIAAALTGLCLAMFPWKSTSRPSTSLEIAAQMKLQEKWNAEQKEAELKWDSTLKSK